MGSQEFAFKQFKINQDQCAMKIGTDSVLLGAMVSVNPIVKKILDIGTGTGILALMIAQKCDADIDAIEIDAQAINQSKSNFIASPWKERLNLYPKSLQNYIPEQALIYDSIVSNPPYFRSKKNVLIEDLSRSTARHDQDLPFEDLQEHVLRLLKPEGEFWVILPQQEALEFIKMGSTRGLFLQKEIWVQPKKSKGVNRLILCFGKRKALSEKSNFIIYEEDGTATEAYVRLTYDYYLWENRTL